MCSILLERFVKEKKEENEEKEESFSQEESFGEFDLRF